MYFFINIFCSIIKRIVIKANLLNGGASMKIAVMAGTPIDSQLGEDLLNKHGYNDIVKVPISKNPVEQTTFQALDDSEQEDIKDGMKQALW